MVGVVVDGLYIPELRDLAWMSWLAWLFWATWYELVGLSEMISKNIKKHFTKKESASACFKYSTRKQIVWDMGQYQNWLGFGLIFKSFQIWINIKIIWDLSQCLNSLRLRSILKFFKILLKIYIFWDLCHNLNRAFKAFLIG